MPQAASCSLTDELRRRTHSESLIGELMEMWEQAFPATEQAGALYSSLDRIVSLAESGRITAATAARVNHQQPGSGYTVLQQLAWHGQCGMLGASHACAGGVARPSATIRGCGLQTALPTNSRDSSTQGQRSRPHSLTNPAVRVTSTSRPTGVAESLPMAGWELAIGAGHSIVSMGLFGIQGHHEA